VASCGNTKAAEDCRSPARGRACVHLTLRHRSVPISKVPAPENARL
jgi:hypothetical protein